MSDTVLQRRQPPSPLIFSPETVLSPPNTTSSNIGSGANAVSMPFVRRHVTRRLKAAKADCDKELQKVTNNITVFFEERLRDDNERDYVQDSDQLVDFGLHPSELRSAFQADESSSDGGYDAEIEYSSRHSRQRMYPDEDPGSAFTHWASSPGLYAASATSSATSPSSHRRPQVPWDRPLSSSLSSGALSSSPAQSTIHLPEAPLSRKQHSQGGGPNSWNNQGISARRLSRTIHVPSRPSHSGQSSRSTSRSRSPLPPMHSHSSFSDYPNSAGSTSNRRSSRILVDDPVDPIMGALYEIIGVATDVMDMSIAQLTAQPKICSTLVQRIQDIGKAWDDHPDWHGRNWYVQVLLAVASLSRVVEWWEAEKAFWNFDDNDEGEDALTFVMKPADDIPPPAPTPTVRRQGSESAIDNFRLNPEDDLKLKMSRTVSQPRRHRDEHPKGLASLSQSKEATDSPSKLSAKAAHSNSESARVLATERLRLQAETARDQNMVMELSLDGDHFIWINHAWIVVVGTNPEELSGTRISVLLHPADSYVFKEATQRLLEDDSHTVEARFRLEVQPTAEQEFVTGQTIHQEMEGKGMLMIDREDGAPSHTMWVVKPIGQPRYEQEAAPTINLVTAADVEDPSHPSQPGFPHARWSEQPDTPFPFGQPITTEPILCQICECPIPQWYFEKHSETCAETHRLEAEIAECNESIAELRTTIMNLAGAVDRSSPGLPAPEYRGMPLFSPSTSPVTSSPLQLFRANKMQRMGVKKIQRRVLDQLEDILLVAWEVSVPSLKEDEAKEPIERQRLLSPGSERKMSQVRNWSKPQTEDTTLAQLVQDCERVMRQKIDNVVRMQNTIRYSEKIWHEWEEKVNAYLANEEASSSDDSDSDEEDGEIYRGVNSKQIVPEDDVSSTTSEYAFSGESQPDPTPIASISPTPPPIVSPPETRPTSAPIPQGHSPHPVRHPLHTTRSSTPSSVSSPLALAAPIIAASSDESAVPAMSLDDTREQPRGKPREQSRERSRPPASLTTRKSSSSLLEPKFIITPPASPSVVARDVPAASLSREPSTKRGHRRQSTAANMVTSPSSGGPLSPRLSTSQPLARPGPTSIKDFDIIKPISKGAFGSVFLAKKKVTGAYYAIKVLKKADMIAKNQITNVKAERMILMKQSDSPFVAKLYYTFQSKDNLYLVMEYLNGGDCAALIKTLGSLPEEWTRQYVAEVALGLEYLHERGVVHRDLKPDNLLIDQHGHLKLTDFGLSRIGLLGRQTRENQLSRPHTRYSSRSRPPSMDSAYLASPLVNPEGGGSYFNPRTTSGPRVGHSPHAPTDDLSESMADGFQAFHSRKGKSTESPMQSFATELTNDLRSHSHSNSNSASGTPPGEQKFVGTPDYLAPETILGLRGDDAAVDWWALGVITYEFLYGIPPFHSETPERVFENILSGVVEWHDDWVDFSPEARDFMARLMTVDPTRRLGSNGAEEVKSHPFFEGVEWDQVSTTEAAFIPQVDDPESTDYFDPRGAIPQLFHDDDQILAGDSGGSSPVIDASMPPPPVPPPSAREGLTSPPTNDFGSFSFKNLPVLKQANDDLLRKMKTDRDLMSSPVEGAAGVHQRRRSTSQRIKKPPSVVTTTDPKHMHTGPPSPATSTSSIASSPSRASLPPSTPSSHTHSRKPSEYTTVERFKRDHMDSGHERRNSRLRTASISSTGDGSGSETWNSSINTPPSSVHSIDLRKGPDPTDRAVTCLLAEDNPITAKIIETLLIRLGCRVVVASDGSEAISVAMGDIKFDCILMDLYMPVLDGEGAARYIKSTNSKNTNTPIVSVSAYSGTEPESSNVFTASLSKPLAKADLLAVMRQLGFKTTTIPGGPGNNTKLTASHIVS